MASPRPDVTVFVPARNEEGNIPLLMDKIARTFDAHGIDGEIVFVNDGSADGTLREAEEAARRYPFLRIVTHRRSLGLTEAMKTGFSHARGDRIVFLCADLTSDPEEDIPRLLGKLDEGYDMVAGWRQGRKDGKVFASRVANAVCRWLFDVEAHDMNWVKAFTREVMEDLTLRSDWHRFIYMLAAAKGYRVGEVQTPYFPRQRGASKFGLMRIPISFLDVIALKFQTVFSRKPMLFFGGLGVLLMATGGALFIYLAYLWLTIQTQQRPLFTLAVMFVLSGLQLFVTGFLADLVVTCDDRVEKLERILKRGAPTKGEAPGPPPRA
jgi:glycosyltransferase involved in cell wall biosynthesis